MVRSASIVFGTLACLALLGRGHAQPITGTKNGPRSTFTIITAPDADKTSSSLSKRQERLEARAGWATAGKVAGVTVVTAAALVPLYGLFRYVTADDKKD